MASSYATLEEEVVALRAQVRTLNTCLHISLHYRPRVGPPEVAASVDVSSHHLVTFLHTWFFQKLCG
jgi:hypothetical protein